MPRQVYFPLMTVLRLVLAMPVLAYAQPVSEKQLSVLEKRDLVKGLLEAARKGDLAALKRDLDRGLDINEGLGGYSAVSVAAERNQIEAVKFLLQRGANINSKTTENPLHAAARSGSFDAVRLLVERGADVNWVNSRNLNPLNWAATWGHTKIVEYLIGRGANVNLVDKACGNANCRSAIHQAAYVGAWPAFVALIKAGANVNQQDETGKSGLHWAVYSCDVPVVTLVLSKEPNSTLKDKNGRTSLQLANFLLNEDALGKAKARELKEIIRVLSASP